ncbi:MAG: hydantoinase B/oxoprolinase family protein [Bacteroidales bacterium]|nr:hydantoinase B/oxoprolinase family protein [Bacteroidales bacterium]
MSKWKIWIDTGGTFTDCMAISPDCSEHRVKVLSTGTLRGKITDVYSPGKFKIEQNWEIDNDILLGFKFRFLNDKTGYETEILSFNSAHSLLELKDKSTKAANNAEFEISSGEEAPLLAARIATSTPLEKQLPAIDIRLGSTKGTNALLERKGSKPMLLITKGFADLTVIGNQQRNHLFTLNIQKPEQVFAKVIEVNERIDANGNVIQELTEPEINKVLRQVFHLKPQVVVISFMNSYRNPQHEKIFLNLLNTAGIKFVCASFQLDQNIKYLPRTQTLLVNGYLMPVIDKYLNNIRKGIQPDSSLKIMTSSGGLVDSNSYHPKDSLLSGPAGGVAGAAGIGKAMGFDKLISFDMGGTSTDVARYNNQFNYVYQTKVGGQQIMSPALYIETVAAGGGSVCGFDGHRFYVGPESAGASPGPACYGAGGPLTLTDVNLLLGRLDPKYFGIPVRRNDAKSKLVELKGKYPSIRQIADEDILNGFLDIANEKMAKAIEKISVRKGYEPSEYILLAFGGAGGMHVCKIAEILGIGKIIIPYDAGILSAVGIGNAQIEYIASRQILTLYDQYKDKLIDLLEELREEAVNNLKEQGFKDNEIDVKKIVLMLRFRGQDNVLEITYSKGKSIPEEFKSEYEKLFGHYIENQAIEVESVKLFAAGGSVSERVLQNNYKEYIPERQSEQECYVNGKWSRTAVYNVDELKEGAIIDGPAIILNKTSTSFIDQDWRAAVKQLKNMLVEKVDTGKDSKEFNKPDEVLLELFTNRFMSVVSDMGALLERTAFSVNIKERLDFSCALLDNKGYLVVNAQHIPVHLGALGLCVRKIISEFLLEEGDIIITNHPAYGGSHLPDVTLIAPVYHNGNLVAFLANRAHHAELGGISPGSMPANATNLEEEGVVISPVYLMRKNKPDFKGVQNILLNAKYPTRSINENMADIRAAVASIRLGQKLMNEMCMEYGIDRILQYINKLKDYASACLREKLNITTLPVSAVELLDDGNKIAVSINRSDDFITISFEGTSGQHKKNMNATPAIVQSAVLYFLRLLIDEDIPLNEGLLENVRIEIPRSLLNPQFTSNPANSPAVVGGNVEVSQRLVDTLLKAFKLSACSQGTMNNLLFGNKKFGFYETICGGVGASEGFQGASAVHQHLTNTRITDPEIMEQRYPVMVEEFSIRKDSGGRGKWNGGEGVIRKIRFLEDVTLTLLSQHREIAPYGMNGGGEGRKGEQYLIRENGERIPFKGIETIEVKRNEVIEIRTPGGGAWGKTE